MLSSRESMIFPVLCQLAGNFRHEFARDCPLQRRVCELSVPEHHAINPRNNLLRRLAALTGWRAPLAVLTQKTRLVLRGSDGFAGGGSPSSFRSVPCLRSLRQFATPTGRNQRCSKSGLGFRVTGQRLISSPMLCNRHIAMTIM